MLLATHTSGNLCAWFQDIDPAYDGFGTAPGVSLVDQASLALTPGPVGLGLLSNSSQLFVSGDNGERPRPLDRYAYERIVPGSPTGSYAPVFPNNHSWIFTWRTNDWTDPSLDRVIVSDNANTGGACLIGSLEFTPNDPAVTVVETQQKDGTFLHKMTVLRNDCTPRCEYEFEVSSTDFGITFANSGNILRIKRCAIIGLKSGDVPTGALLTNATPNPFNPVTQLRFYLPENARRVELEIFNARGQRIWEYEVPSMQRGWCEVSWYGVDTKGRKQPSGVFFTRLSVDGTSQVKKLIMLK